MSACKSLIEDQKLTELTSAIIRNEISKNCTEIDMGQLDEIINDCKVVFVEVPEFELEGEGQVIVAEEFSDLDGPQTEDAHAIYIEVPQAVSEETIGCYSELSSTSENLPKNLQEAPECETDPLASTDGDFLVTKTEFVFEENQVAPIKKEKPVISVKKLESLINLTPKVIRQAPIEVRTKERKLSHGSKVGKARHVSRKAAVPASPADSDKTQDLMWLLNFKLDDLIQNNALDELADTENTSLDAKKNEVGVQSQNKRRSSCEEKVTSASSEEPRKKPPFTYTELIECALQEKGPLTVSEIYQWISETFPYYKAWDDRWKNSVRHNLSINPYFRKGSKARQGSGHLWTVSKSAESSRSWNLKRQRYQEFEAYTKRMRQEEKSNCPEPANCEQKQKKDAELDAELEAAREAEMAAAAIEDKENCIHSHIESLAIEQSAGEILSGVKRNVAVEFIEPSKQTSADNSNDFLNPVSKEVLMGECGFLSQIELNLTAESTEHMEIVETEHAFDRFEDLGFQFSDVTGQCTQLLSLVN